MFVEIKELPLILEYGRAGMLYDSVCYAGTEDEPAEMWDGPMPTPVDEVRDHERRYHEEREFWKFYIYLED